MNESTYGIYVSFNASKYIHITDKHLLAILTFIIPHLNVSFKTFIDERLIFDTITHCYSEGK